MFSTVRSKNAQIPGMQTRASVVPASIDVEKRTVDVTWTTGAAVLRTPFWDDPFYEELSLDPSQVRMERLQSGRSPALLNHSSYDVAGVVGVIQKADLRSDGGVATIRFARAEDDAEADKIFRKVKDGIITNVSVGYRVWKYEQQPAVAGQAKDAPPTFRAVDWEPYEVSFVGIGADADAIVRSTDKLNTCQFVSRSAEMPQMDPVVTPTAAPAVSEETRAAEMKAIREAEATRATEIRALVSRTRQSPAWADELVLKGISLADARAEVIERMAKFSDETPHHALVEVGSTDGDKWARGAVSGMLARAGQLDSALRMKAKGEIGFQDVDADPGEFRSMRPVKLAEELLQRAGVSTRGLSERAIIDAAFNVTKRTFGMRGITGEQTTSDFAVLLENVMYKMLLGGYVLADDTWKRVCKTDSVNDFRPSNRYRTGTFGALPNVVEGAEFTNTPVPDGLKQPISVGTYGRMLTVSRQALINDDMGAIMDTMGKFGRSAALTIENAFYALLNQNSGLGPTFGSNPFFDSSNANVNGTGSALSIQGIDADRVILGRQKDISGNEYLNLAQAGRLTLLVPIELAGQAKNINQSKYDVSQSSKFEVPNIVLGLFRDVVDSPRLTGTRRYLFADPSDAAAFVVSFLNGQSSPFMEQRLGWRVDGTEIKIRLDFGVQAFDPKGAITNAGA